MKTITIIPKNEEVVPFLEQLLSSMDCVSDFQVNENGAEECAYNHIPNEETLQAIKEVEAGNVIEIGSIEDYRKWAESIL